MRAVFLGTATSYGVPQVGCTCSTCTSEDPRDFRTRASLYLESDEGTRFLIDSGPDLRAQVLRERVTRVDAVLYTHFHADHTAGIDDLKPFNAALRGLLHCYGNAETLASLTHRFKYAFDGTPWIGLIPHIDFTVVTDQPFYVGETCVQPIPLRHGLIGSTGYRVGDFAYLTDTNGVSESSRVLLRNLDTLVLDTFGWDPHPTHFSVPQALELIAALRPRRTYLTHVSHALEHAVTNRRLGPGIELAYDGLSLTD
jgi:phosphoribosyl 1,2-cyclic phosphate phosphodiesterase